MQKLLIIDDNSEFLQSTQRALRDYQIMTATSAETARLLIYHDLDLVMLDLRLKEDDDANRDSLTLLKLIKAERPLLPVMIITAYRDYQSVVECLNAGADHFLQKGWKLAELRLAITETIKKVRVSRQVDDFVTELARLRPIPELVGEHPALQAIRELIPAVAAKDMPVLICGPAGSGKETVARLIHALSPRLDIPFVRVNCDRSDKSVEETRRELFGYRDDEHQQFIPGAFERADRGAIFLRALDALDLLLQADILRAINKGLVQPVGQSAARQVDVRIMASAAAPEAIQPDLYQRLNTRLALPPLAARCEDIPALVSYFLKQLQKQDGRIISISGAAVDHLKSYAWCHHQVRELKDAVFFSRSECRGPHILPEHLPVKIRDSFSPFLGSGGPPIPEAGLDLKKQVARYQLHWVEKALQQTGGRKIEAARLLQFNNRHTFKRLVDGLVSDYGDMAMNFPLIEEFYVEKENRA